MNELEEEVKASEQRRRVRNHSQSCKAPEEEEKEEDDGVAEEGTASPPPLQAYERLPPDSRTLALKISKMGFSVNVVATVIEQLGNDDKKVRIEFFYQQFLWKLMRISFPVLSSDCRSSSI